MPRHSNAIGYLIDLRDQESLPWFSWICDNAISSSGRALQKDEIILLIEILLGEKPYTPISASPVTTTTSTTQPPGAFVTNHLQEICEFSNFKGLSPDLKLVFDKPVTLIFGCNGSGKSSLCEAIKILSSPENPQNPLKNVREQTTTPCNFKYQFNAEPGPVQWDVSQGYGVYSNRIKYFDSSIAVQHITGSAEPERIVRIEPFRLEIFTYAGRYVRQLNVELNKIISIGQTETGQKIELLKAKFEKTVSVETDAITNITSTNCKEIETVLKNHVPVDSAAETKHSDNKKTIESLVKARSKEGLKLQQTECEILLQYGHSIKRFIKLVKSQSLEKTIVLSKNLDSLLKAKTALATMITPEGIDSKYFEDFLNASQKLIDYEIVETQKCPFCRREFDEHSLQLVKSYHEFLIDEIGTKVKETKDKLNKAFDNLTRIKDFALAGSSPILPIIQEVQNNVSLCIQNNQGNIPNDKDLLINTDHTGFGELDVLKETVSLIAREVLQRYRAIKLSSVSEDEFQKKCHELERKINEFEYRKFIDDNKSDFENIVSSTNHYNALTSLVNRIGFSNYLRKITNKGKEAYLDCVVTEFERSVDDEYKRMSGQKMSDFGITLTSTGADQSVVVNTNIGEESISRVFSEGEQKVHALALFFSEASVSDHHIMVFDDPVTSFDYNYSARYAERLRDYILNKPDVQVIILTHNWDFFVYMQLVVNQSNLNSRLSVKVLEHCCIVEEYSEKIQELKQEIDSILAVTGEPSRHEKDRLAGYLRRLIESVVNKRVFNNQRHQFKQKTMAVSAFSSFTKIVPLNDSEAQRLRDLYRSLSVPEHEDPRNYYAMLSKVQYQSFYEDIIQIESDLISRRP